MKRSNQYGFAAIEALLIVVILAIVVGTGYFVWHSKQATETSLSNTALSTPATQVKKQSTAKQTASQTTTSSAQYLTIKEWGVRMKETAAQSSLFYTVSSSTPNVIYLSFKTVTSIAPNCNELAAVSRLTQAEQDDATANPSDTNTPGSVKIGSYWYGYEHSHAACTDSDAQQAAIEKAQPSADSDLFSIFKTIEAIQ